MNNVNLLAIDVAKNIFQLHGVDKQGKCQLRKRSSTGQFFNFYRKDVK